LCEIRKEAAELLAEIRHDVAEFEDDIRDDLLLLAMLAKHF